jgi:high-affinity nickel-transport protein
LKFNHQNEDISRLKQNPKRAVPKVSEESKSLDSKAKLSLDDQIKIGIVYSLIGIATLFGFVASASIGRFSALLAGLGIIAYVFGLRHGVDADHIAAIDNTTRKLLQDNQRPFTVGMWFSLGHSTIVIALIVGLVFATRTVIGSIPTLVGGGSVIGTTVSGIFLWLIGIVNLVIVLSIYRIYNVMKKGHLDQSELENLLDKRGFMNRYFRPLFKIVRRPWQIYPIGLLFGLGFDTATEVALIAISVGIGVSSDVPIWMILVLPFMFTCGMVLIDTTDGLAMRLAYGWAFINPIRKIYYNLTVTVISVLVALVIGSVELLQVAASELSFTGLFWDWIIELDFETIGYLIIAIFVLSWIISLGYWKYRRLDEKYVTSDLNRD